MFTRYSDMEIPGNYNGSRFRKTSAEDTSTKTHRPDSSGASRITLSPSFEQRNRSANVYQFAETEEETYAANNSDSTGISSESGTYIHKETQENNAQYSGNEQDQDGDYISDEIQNQYEEPDKYLFTDENEYGQYEGTEDEEAAQQSISDKEKITVKEEHIPQKKTGLLADLHLSKLGDLFEKTDSEEILLLCMLLLLASDADSKNDDMLLLLAMLLLYHRK